MNRFKLFPKNGTFPPRKPSVFFPRRFLRQFMQQNKKTTKARFLFLLNFRKNKKPIRPSVKPMAGCADTPNRLPRIRRWETIFFLYPASVLPCGAIIKAPFLPRMYLPPLRIFIKTAVRQKQIFLFFPIGIITFWRSQNICRDTM